MDYINSCLYYVYPGTTCIQVLHKNEMQRKSFKSIFKLCFFQSTKSTCFQCYFCFHQVLCTKGQHVFLPGQSGFCLEHLIFFSIDKMCMQKRILIVQLLALFKSYGTKNQQLKFPVKKQATYMLHQYIMYWIVFSFSI